ncbi:MAG: hypothetical protein AAGA83_00400 [Cyanobacteria bacterium P01_F01_bin.116]
MDYPETQLRYAGEYSPKDWRKLSRENPQLTQALIELRQAQSDQEKAEKTLGDVATIGAIGIPTAVGIGTVAYRQGDRFIDRGRDWWINQTMAQPGTIYQGQVADLSVPQPGMVRFGSELDTTNVVHAPISDIKNATRAFSQLENTPDGQRVFYTIPENKDGMGQRRAQFFKKRGFTSADWGPEKMMVKDNRFMAPELGKVYQQVDRLAGNLKINPAVRQRTKYAGAAGLGIGAGVLALTAANKVREIFRGDN